MSRLARDRRIGLPQGMDCPPNWNAAGNGLQGLADLLLTDEVVRLLRVMRLQMLHMGFEKGLPDLFALERKSRSQVTLLAQRMTRSDQPMEMPPPLDSLWMVIRCQCACDFLGQLFPPLAKTSPVPEMQGEWNERTAAAWLLTELWERKADSWLKLVALEWLGPFPFYGVEPAPDWM